MFSKKIFLNSERFGIGMFIYKKKYNLKPNLFGVSNSTYKTFRKFTKNKITMQTLFRLIFYILNQNYKGDTSRINTC